MHYVYLLRSVTSPAKTYIGYTKDVPLRLQEHNDGASIYTAQHKPWKLITSIEFNDRDKAIKFEQYLKSGSGRVFTKKHLL